MPTDETWDEFAALPPEAKTEVVDFIAFLAQRYASSARQKLVKKQGVASEPFIGIWRDRAELEDSTAWVRNVRRTEWAKRVG